MLRLPACLRHFAQQPKSLRLACRALSAAKCFAAAAISLLQLLLPLLL